MLNKVLVFLFSLVLTSPAWPQASLLPNAKQTFVDINGAPLASGTVDLYVPNSTTRKNTWTNSTETNLNTNPIMLDGAGRAIIFGQGTYRQVVKDSMGNTQWDAITTAPSSGTSVFLTDAAPVGTMLPYTGFTLPTNYLWAYGQAVSRTTYADLLNAVAPATAGTTVTGVATIAGLTADTTFAVKVGAFIEGPCFPANTTVTAFASSTSLTTSAVATSNGACTVRIFPFGHGNGSTTFNVPDMRGRTIAGQDNIGNTPAGVLTSAYCLTSGVATGLGLGSSCGSQLHAMTTAEMVAHVHTSPALTDPGHTHFIANTDTVTSTLVSATNRLANVGTQSGAVSAYTLTGSATASTIGLTSSSTTGTTIAANTGSTGSTTAFSVVQPSLLVNWIIKYSLTSPSDAGGVISLGGMTGDILCGTNLACASQTISVTNSGSGSIGQSVTASPYNATCDNSADAFTAIQNALNSGNKLVYIPPGNRCKSSSQLVIPAGVTFQIYEGSQLNRHGSSATSMLICGGDGVRILGPGIIDMLNDPLGNVTISCAGKTDTYIGGFLTIQNSTLHDIYYQESPSWTIENVTLKGNNYVSNIQVYNLASDSANITINNVFCDRTALAGTCAGFVPQGGHTVSRLNVRGMNCVGPAGDVSGTEHSCLTLLGLAPGAFPQFSLQTSSAYNFNFPFSLVGASNGTVVGNNCVAGGTTGYGYEIAANTNMAYIGNSCEGQFDTGSPVVINSSIGVSWVGGTVTNTGSSGAAFQALESSGAGTGQRNVISGTTIRCAASTCLDVTGDNYVLTGIFLYGGGTATNAVNLNTGSNRVVTSLNATGFTGAPLVNKGATDIVCGNNFMGCDSVTAGSGVIEFKATGIDFNSALSDNAIPIILPSGTTRYRISSVNISAASTSLTTATAGVFTAVAGGGAAISSAGAITVSSTAENTNNNAQSMTINNAGTQSYDATTLYFRVGVPQGSAATGTVTIAIIPVS